AAVVLEHHAVDLEAGDDVLDPGDPERGNGVFGLDALGAVVDLHERAGPGLEDQRPGAVAQLEAQLVLVEVLRSLQIGARQYDCNGCTSEHHSSPWLIISGTLCSLVNTLPGRSRSQGIYL